jgi:AcrR family transcriptional regulator
MMKRARSRGGSATQREQNGAQTRQEIVSTALRLAALEGLSGMTLGEVAAALKMSKAGIYAHFSSKEALQLEALEAGYQQFIEEVAAPAMEAPPGLARLRKMLDAYVAYIQARKDRGGCLFTSLALEYDGRPGAIRDRLREIRRLRTELLEAMLEEARETGELDPKVDVKQLAFEAITLTLGANVDFTLTRDPAVFKQWDVALTWRLAQVTSAGAGRRRAQR